MKLALIGDLHARGKDLDRIDGALSSAVRIARERGCERIIQAGDVFDRYNVSDRSASVGSIYRAVIDAFDGFSIQTDIVPGNHDMAGAGQKDALEPLPDVEIHRQAELDIMDGGRTAVLYIPWGCEPIIDDTAMELWYSATRRLIVSHCEIAGSLTNTDRMMTGHGFTLDKEWIKSLNADVVALGHIHLRQDLGLGKVWGGYLGSLVQTGFGEGLNYEPGKDRGHQPQGFAIWDTDSNTIEWVELDTPKYWTIPAEWYPDLRSQIPEGDLIRIIGDVPPSELPEGVEFQKRVTVEAKRSRVEGATADRTPGELLDLWMDEQKVTANRAGVHDGLKTIEGDVTIPGSAIGSLERIDWIKLENIATHKFTDIDFYNLNGLIGVSGSNGSGKTYIMESLYAALFGEFPSRPGTLADRFTRGLTGDARVEVGFDSHGCPCEVSRFIHKTTKTGSVTANLLIDGLPKAGPKVADVTNACTNLVGDPELLLASIYSVQGQAGNLIDASPAQRKELMAKLLGTDRFLVLGEAAKKRGESDEREAGYLARDIEGLKLKLEGREQTTEAHRQAGAQAFTLGQKEQESQEVLDELTKRLNVLEGVAADRFREEQDVTRIKQEINSLDYREHTISEEIRIIEVRLSKRPELELTASERNDCEANILEAQANAATYRNEKWRLEGELNRLRSEYREINSEWERKRDQQQSALKQAVMEAEARFNRLDNEFQNRKRDLETRKRNLEQKARLLESGDFTADVCKVCVFTKDAFVAKTELQHVGESLKQNVPPKEWFEAEDEKRIAFENHDRFDSSMPPEYTARLEANKASGMEAKRQYDALQEPDPQILHAAQDYLKNVIQVAERELAKLEELEPLVGQKESELERIALQLTDAQNRLQEAEQRVLAAENPAEQIDDAKLAQSRAKQDLQSVRDELSRVQQEIGRLQERLNAYEITDALIVDVTSKMETIRNRCERWSVLTKAFSRDGIPQLIVDSAIPRLQEITNDLLSEFDNRWGIRMDTQYQTKAGTIQERFDIRVLDSTGEDDISAFSGGEKHLLRTIVRVALAMLQAERSGKALKVFIFDEAFDSLDSENARRLLAVFRHLEDLFNQVFIISHSDELLAEISNRIHVSKQNDIAQVTVNGVGSKMEQTITEPEPVRTAPGSLF